jgi:hypothetical protein
VPLVLDQEADLIGHFTPVPIRGSAGKQLDENGDDATWSPDIQNDRLGAARTVMANDRNWRQIGGSRALW